LTTRRRLPDTRAVARIRIPVHDAYAKYEAGEVRMIDQLTTSQDREATQKIAGAIRMPAAELPDRLDELPRERGVISYCT